MNSEKNPKGTWGMRSLVIFFSVILGALIYWLLGFILSDLDTIPGPDLSQFEERTIQSADRDTLQEYDTQIATCSGRFRKSKRSKGPYAIARPVPK